MPRTPSHKVILLPWLTGVWLQTEVLLGSEKLDLVEVSERVFSGNVCNKGQAEFGEGKQSTLCSTGPSIGSTVRVTRAGGTHKPEKPDGQLVSIFALSIPSVLSLPPFGQSTWKTEAEPLPVCSGLPQYGWWFHPRGSLL